jgi:hypothetical protein
MGDVVHLEHANLHGHCRAIRSTRDHLREDQGRNNTIAPRI